VPQEAPACLDGTMAGDVGFDPLRLSELDFDFRYFTLNLRGGM
jgi:hypothetical protein